MAETVSARPGKPMAERNTVLIRDSAVGFDELACAFDLLPVGEQKEMLAQLQYRATRSSERAVRTLLPYTDEWSGIQAAAAPDRLPPVSVVTAELPKLYTARMAAFSDYLTAACGKRQLGGGERVALAQAVAELVIDWMRSTNKPITPKSVLSRLGQTWLVDRAYPGYAEAGFLHVLVTMPNAA